MVGDSLSRGGLLQGIPRVTKYLASRSIPSRACELCCSAPRFFTMIRAREASLLHQVSSSCLPPVALCNDCIIQLSMIAVERAHPSGTPSRGPGERKGDRGKPFGLPPACCSRRMPALLFFFPLSPYPQYAPRRTPTRTHVHPYARDSLFVSSVFIT